MLQSLSLWLRKFLLSKSASHQSSPLRIVLLGPECSGKTTLARALAEHYQSFWVPEYWRFYWDAKHLARCDPIWASEEFLHVAELQTQLEEHYAGLSKRVLICDTDAFAIGIWHFRYLNFFSDAINQFAFHRQRDLVLLCAPDINFIQDGTRDGEAIRHEMHGWIKEKLEQSHYPFIELKGEHVDRFVLATNHIDALINSSFSH